MPLLFSDEHSVSFCSIQFRCGWKFRQSLIWIRAHLRTQSPFSVRSEQAWSCRRDHCAQFSLRQIFQISFRMIISVVQVLILRTISGWVAHRNHIAQASRLHNLFCSAASFSLRGCLVPSRVVFTAKHLTVFGLFRIALQNVAAKKRGKIEENRWKYRL